MKPPTAIYLAGSEVETLTRALLDNGAKRVLYSFYYIQQMNRGSFIEKIQREFKDVEWFLDSGAFTYWMKASQEGHKLMEYKKYKRNYYQYIQEGWNRWSRVAELDLDNMPGVSLESLSDWRDEAWDMGVKNFMPVWHATRGMEEWAHYVRDRRWRYLAIGSGGGSYSSVTGGSYRLIQNVIGQQRRMILQAHQWGKLVHGFGMTRVNTVLPYLPFDSVDSTSWLMGQKFGTIFVFRDNKFSLIGKDGLMGKDKRKTYRSYFKAIGIDYKKIEEDDIAEVRKANITAWINLSNRLEYIRKVQGRSLYGMEKEIEKWKGLNPYMRWDESLERQLDEQFLTQAGERSSEWLAVLPASREEEQYVEAKEREPEDYPQPLERPRERSYTRD